MPYITRVQIAECRNVRDLDVDLSVPVAENGTAEGRPRFRHLILTGPNGSGKSGVLEAVAQSWGNVLQCGMHLLPARLEWTPVDDAPGAFRTGQHVAVHLRAKREASFQPVAGPKAMTWSPAEILTYDAMSAHFVQFLVNKRIEALLAAGEGDHATASRLDAWFDRFAQNLRRLFEDDRLTVDFDRRAFKFTLRTGDGHAFGFDTLADGHAAVLAILAALLIRVETAQRARGDFTFQPEGVVIVDEIETHLHPSLQEQILPLLTDLFPTFQLLVATHSPAVIASISGAVVYDLRKRRQVLSDAFRGVRYGTLMTEHFGISSEIDLDSTEKLRALRHLAHRADRSPEEDGEMERLAEGLSARSPALAVEVWMVKEGLSNKVPLAGAAE